MVKTITLPATHIITKQELNAAKRENVLALALVDQRIDRSERKQLRRMGYSARRLAKLAGSDGWNPLRRKMRWYGETLSHTAMYRSAANGEKTPRSTSIMRFFFQDAAALPGSSKHAVPGLMRALTHPQPEIRFQGAEALGKISPREAKQALPLLLHRLTKERDVEVYDKLQSTAIEVGFDAKNIHVLAVLLSRREEGFARRRLVSLESLTIFQLEEAQHALQRLPQGSEQVKKGAAQLFSMLEEEMQSRALATK